MITAHGRPCDMRHKAPWSNHRVALLALLTCNPLRATLIILFVVLLHWIELYFFVQRILSGSSFLKWEFAPMGFPWQDLLKHHMDTAAHLYTISSIGTLHEFRKVNPVCTESEYPKHLGSISSLPNVHS